MTDNSSEPLLRQHRRAQADAAADHIHEHINWLSPAGSHSALHAARTWTQRLLASKAGHATVLLLVALDAACIVADLVVRLYVCERELPDKGWGDAQRALGIVTLVLACVFVAELLAAVWAFGLPYFKSGFHCFDAVVIVAGLVVAVWLRGVLKEVVSLIVVLRLWRVFVIIQEFSVGAKEQIDALSERVGQLEVENGDLVKELREVRVKNGGSFVHSADYQR